MLFIGVFDGEEPRDENLEELEALQKRLPKKWEGRWPFEDRIAQRLVLQRLRREAEEYEEELEWDRQMAETRAKASARIKAKYAEQMAQLADFRAENDRIIQHSEEVRKRVEDWLGIKF